MIAQFLAWFHANGGAIFRVGYVAVATVFTWNVTEWARHYAELALAAKADPTGTAAVIGAVSACAAAIQTFAFKHALENTP